MCGSSIEGYFDIMIFPLIFCRGKVDENGIFPFPFFSTNIAVKIQFMIIHAGYRRRKVKKGLAESHVALSRSPFHIKNITRFISSMYDASQPYNLKVNLLLRKIFRGTLNETTSLAEFQPMKLFHLDIHE